MDVTIDNDVNLKEYYYFNSKKSICLPFNSKKPEKSVIESRTNNIFESVEICASYCPTCKFILLNYKMY